MSFRITSPLKAAALTALLLASVAPATPAGSIDKALPKNTVAFIRVENMARLREAFSTSQMGQLWADEAMKPMRTKLEEMLNKPDQEIKEALGATLGEILDLPQGEVAIALVSRDSKDIPVALLAVADAGSNADKMLEVMARVDQIAEREGAAVATEEFNGITMHVIRDKDNQDQPPLVWAQNGTVFHISSDIDALKDLASNAAGRADSLASNENYTAVVRKIADDAHGIFFVDLAQAIDLAVLAAGDQGINGEQIAAQMQLLGINGLKALGGAITFNTADFDSIAKLFVYAPGEKQGILKLFQMPPADLRPEPWVPAGVASYASYSFDVDAFWNSLSELVDQFAPGVLEQAEKALSDQPGGFSLKNDLLGPFAKRITAIGDYKQPITEDSQRMVVAFALDNPAAAQTTLNKIIDMANATPKKRTFQGETIYDFELPAELEVAASGIEGPISLVIAKNYMFISTEPTLIEQILRGGYQSLTDTDEYQAVSKHFPSMTNIVGFTRADDSIQGVYSMLQGDQFRLALEQMKAQAPEDAPDLAALFDPKLLPEFDAIKKYLQPSGSYAVPDDDGVVMTQFTLKKPN